ncbi:cell division protein FtsL [Parafannyhessea umbonata]|uniref:cell division protein FtsL n=1 Tax=Parafannyhessea umbonata TaxID=604330 RepID=UPI00359C2176
MGMMGSEAYSYYGNAYERPREVERHAPFEVVRGGGLDARVRSGVSAAFWTRFKLFVACALAFAVIGICRVALTAATVSNLTQANALEEKISTSASANSDLKIERSVLSSSSRINAIATQNYGMVPSTDTESMDASAKGDDASAKATSDDAQQASAKDAQSSDVR